MEPRYTIALYNNPPCHIRLENIVKRQVWEDYERPHLDISGTQLPDGPAQLCVWVHDAAGRELWQGRQDLQIEGGRFQHRFNLDATLHSPSSARISPKRGADSDEKFLPIRIHRLHGRTTDFEGRPLQAYVRPMGNGSTTVKADRDGRYEVWLPTEQTFRVFVCDERYSKELLECWLWDVRLSDDLRLDLHIGALELYRLHAWYGERVVYVHFIPMSLHRIKPLVQEGLDEDAIVAHPEAHPRLCRDDVEVLVDGKLCPVRTFAEHPDFLFVRDGRSVSRPGYILSIDKDSVTSAKTKVICVRATHRFERNDRQVVEKGEAYFLGFHGCPESRLT